MMRFRKMLAIGLVAAMLLAVTDRMFPSIG